MFIHKSLKPIRLFPVKTVIYFVSTSNAITNTHLAGALVSGQLLSNKINFIYIGVKNSYLMYG
jgi:hypothetical protein